MCYYTLSWGCFSILLEKKEEILWGDIIFDSLKRSNIICWETWMFSSFSDPLSQHPPKSNRAASCHLAFSFVCITRLPHIIWNAAPEVKTACKCFVFESYSTRPNSSPVSPLLPRVHNALCRPRFYCIVMYIPQLFRCHIQSAPVMLRYCSRDDEANGFGFSHHRLAGKRFQREAPLQRGRGNWL